MTQHGDRKEAFVTLNTVDVYNEIMFSTCVSYPMQFRVRIILHEG